MNSVAHLHNWLLLIHAILHIMWANTHTHTLTHKHSEVLCKIAIAAFMKQLENTFVHCNVHYIKPRSLFCLLSFRVKRHMRAQRIHCECEGGLLKSTNYFSLIALELAHAAVSTTPTLTQSEASTIFNMYVWNRNALKLKVALQFEKIGYFEAQVFLVLIVTFLLLRAVSSL